MSNYPTSIEYIKAGTLRALAVTGATRSELLPNVPTMGDFLPGYEASAVNGIGAPRNTSSEFVDRLNREINAGLAEPRIKTRIAELGFMVLALAPADYGKFNAAEIDKWARVVKFSGAKADPSRRGHWRRRITLRRV